MEPYRLAVIKNPSDMDAELAYCRRYVKSYILLMGPLFTAWFVWYTFTQWRRRKWREANGISESDDDSNEPERPKERAVVGVTQPHGVAQRLR